jgi:hypothetical protein
MVGLVKEMRVSLKEKFPDEKHFMRARPEDCNGKWKIESEIKPRGGEGRFKLVPHGIFHPCA